MSRNWRYNFKKQDELEVLVVDGDLASAQRLFHLIESHRSVTTDVTWVSDPKDIDQFTHKPTFNIVIINGANATESKAILDQLAHTGFAGPALLVTDDFSPEHVLTSREQGFLGLISGTSVDRSSLHRWLDLALKHRSYESQLMEEAMTDPLTRLLNRRSFNRLCQHMLEDELDKGTRVAVMLLDLDDLKQINDTLGHDHGDKVIRCAARAIENSLRSSDLLARLGGDEFVIALKGVSLEQLRQIKHRIGASVYKSGTALPFAPHINCSIGVASAQVSSLSSIDSLVAEADAKMYEEKRAKRRTRLDASAVVQRSSDVTNVIQPPERPSN